MNDKLLNIVLIYNLLYINLIFILPPQYFLIYNTHFLIYQS